MINSINIVELAEKYGLSPKKQGDLYVCFCPFHRDVKRPNFTIYTSTNSFFCYTCSKGGDAIDFYAEIEGITRQQAEFRLFDDLQILIGKLQETVVKEKPYNGAVTKLLSKQFHSFLIKHPERLERVKEVMKEVDQKLTQDLNQGQATELISLVTKRLEEV